MKLREEEKPRERLMSKGADSLQTIELLAILLRTGTKGEDVLDLSKKIYSNYSLPELSQMSCEQLSQFTGVSKAKATSLVSAFELGRRSLLESTTITNKKFLSSRDVIEYSTPYFLHKKTERVLIIYVTAKNTMIKSEIIHEGGIDYSLLDPRELIKKIVNNNASGFFILHNHPSGDPTPSRDDKEITSNIKTVTKCLGTRFLDHIVFGTPNNYYSFFDEGDL